MHNDWALCRRILIFKSEVDVIATKVLNLIGAPVDFTKNKKSGEFADHYDLRIPEDALIKKTGDNLSQHRAKNVPKVREQIKEYVEEKQEVDNYLPIRQLNTFTNDWKIKARVVKKAPIRTWNNAKGTGKILNIDLLDRAGTGIQATFFNDAAEKYNVEIE